MHEFVCLQSMTQFGGTLNSLSRNLPNPGFDDFSKPVSVFKSKPGSRFSNPVLDSLHTAVCTQFSMVLGDFVNTAVYTQTMFAIQLMLHEPEVLWANLLTRPWRN